MRLGYRGLDDETRWTVIDWGEAPHATTADAGRVRVRPRAAVAGVARRSRFAATASSAACRSGPSSRRSRAAARELERANAPNTRPSRRRASDSTNGCDARPPTCACWWRTRRTGRIRTPAFPGSARRSAATAIITATPDAVDQPGHRARRARVSRRDAGRRSRPVARRRAGQDPARDAQQRDGAARRGAVRPLLRQRRRDAALRRARRRVLRPHGRSRVSRARSGRTSSARSTGSTTTATATATASSNTRATRRTDWCSRAGRIRRIRSSTPTARSPTRRSRCARCRGTSTTHGLRAAAMADALGHTDARRRICDSRPRSCAAPSRSASGARRSAPTRWRSTATSSRAACAARTPGTACSAGIADPMRARRVAELLVERRDVLRLGRFARSRSNEVRYNPMSYHNGSVWPHDNGLIGGRLLALRLRRSHFGAVRRVCSTRAVADRRAIGCPSCSADFTGAPAKDRRCIRSPARRRHGRRASCFI